LFPRDSAAQAASPFLKILKADLALDGLQLGSDLRAQLSSKPEWKIIKLYWRFGHKRIDLSYDLASLGPLAQDQSFPRPHYAHDSNSKVMSTGGIAWRIQRLTPHLAALAVRAVSRQNME
jgi:hypothetical protein